MAVPDLAEVRRTLRKVQRFRQRLRGEVDIDALVERGLQIGSNVYVAPWVLIDPIAAYLISIGDGCRLAPRATSWLMTPPPERHWVSPGWPRCASGAGSLWGQTHSCSRA